MAENSNNGENEEEQSPDLSLMARASIGGNLLSRFQISLSEDRGDEDEEEDDDDIVPDSIGSVSTLVSTASSSDDDNPPLMDSPVLSLPEDKPPPLPSQHPLQQQLSDSSIELQYTPPSAGITTSDVQLSIPSSISRRQSYKLSTMRHSLSETDLTIASAIEPHPPFDPFTEPRLPGGPAPPLSPTEPTSPFNSSSSIQEEDMESNKGELKRRISRKNAVRRKKSKEDDLQPANFRKSRSRSVFINTTHGHHPPHLATGIKRSETPPAIPKFSRRYDDDTPPAVPQSNRPLLPAQFLPSSSPLAMSPSQDQQELPSPNRLKQQRHAHVANSSRPLSPNQTAVKSTERPKRFKLHCPRNSEKLRKYLKKRIYDQVERDQYYDTPLHAIVRSRRKDTHELLIALMVYSDFGTEEIDTPAKNHDTALHLAIKNNDVLAVKLLIAFGANINASNDHNITPWDLVDRIKAMSPKSTTFNQIWELLLELDAKSGRNLEKEVLAHRATADISMIKQNIQNENKKEVPSSVLAAELESNINDTLLRYEAINDIDQQIALGLQQFELSGWKATATAPIHFQIQSGKRILFLDGGGIRGLIQIEILSLLEEKTGDKITNLFDWIVGTSTGGIVALGLVYGRKTLAEIRQFYFKMKDEVFAKTKRFGIGGNANTTQALEDILKETLTETARLSDVQEPKVLLAAVNKTTTRPELTFFNNCLGNEFSNEYIWKVARYTSAAPMYFTELDGYIDGGILANNPSDHGLTVIQNFYHRLGQRLDIATIVSVGTGIFPAEDLGCTDVHEMLLGMKILNIQEIQRRAKNLMKLLSNALVGADDAVKNCKCRCEAQGIPFYRFSPTFTKLTIDADEIDDVQLIEMVIETRRQAVREWSEEIDELLDIFKKVALERRMKMLETLRIKKMKNKAKQDDKYYP